MKKGCCLLIVVSFFLVFLLSNCNDPASSQQNSKSNIGITINSPGQSIVKGGEMEFTAVITSSDDTTGGVIWNITGHSNADTRIEPVFSNTYKAVLIVAKEEPSSSLTVIVTSVKDKTRSVSKKIELLSTNPAVAKVTIEPKQAEIIKGAEWQFTAVVEAVNGAPEAVTWSIDDKVKTSNETKISSGGLLYIGEDETAKTLIVTVLSNFNSSKFDTATVTITTSTLPQLDKVTTLSLSSEGVASWSYGSNANLSEFRLQLYKDDAALGQSIRVPSGTSSYNFLETMRESAGVYKFTVTALVSSGNTGFANSPRSDFSTERTVKALANPQAPSWDASSARWPRVADASEYVVELFKEGNDTRIGAERRVAQVSAGTGTTVPNVTYNFNSDLSANKSGSYIFTVKAVTTNKLLLDSETVTVTAPYVYLTFAAGNAPFGSSSLSSVYDVAVNNAGNIFVAVGENGRIGRSANGTSWTNISDKNNNPALDFTAPNDVRAVAYGNGRFVAVGSTGRIITSTDGTKWTRTEDIPKEYTDASASSKLLYTIIWTGEYFITSGINSTYNSNKGTQVLRSSDGLKWERTFNDRTPTANGGGDGKTIFGFANNGGNVLAVGARGTATYSNDHGKSGSWGRISDSILGMSASDDSVRIDAFSTAFGNNTWVVAGADGRIAYTTGTAVTFASDWTLRYANSTRFNNDGKEGDDIRSVVFANGMFIAVSDQGRVSTSSDGHNWYAIPRGTAAGQTRFSSSERINSIKAFVDNGETKFILGGFNRSTGASKIVISE